MSLSDRVALREELLRGVPAQVEADVKRLDVTWGRIPEWRRRQLERLAKVGRVAEKALDR